MLSISEGMGGGGGGRGEVAAEAIANMPIREKLCGSPSTLAKD